MKVSIKNFNSELLIILLRSFLTSLVLVIFKFCLTYHSSDLED